MINISFNPLDEVERLWILKHCLGAELINRGSVEKVTVTRDEGPTISTDPSPAPTEPPNRGKEDKYVIFHPNGEKRAGYMHSKDALKVLQVELGDVASLADLEGFQKHNMPAMSKLDKKDIPTLQLSIAEKVGQLKAAIPTETDAAAPATPPSGSGTPAEPTTVSPSEAGSGTAVTTAASPSEVDLAALFQSPSAGDKVAEVAAENAMTKETYIKEMMAIAKGLGAQESGAWLLAYGYDNILKVPAEKYADAVAKGKARIVELAGG
jgi:hypothetical protein